MNNAGLITASRQIALKRELDVVANNVANIATNGFKRRVSSFAEHLMPTARGDALTAPDKRLSFAISRGNFLDPSRGTIEATGNPLDIALKGDVFLAVGTSQGERYTRNGALSLSSSGELVTSDGATVLSDQGPLTFSAADGDIRIAPDGAISTVQGLRGRLKLVQFDQPQALQNIGGNLLKAEAAARPANPGNWVEPGALERSNVSAVAETARLIEVTRSYTTLAQMMQRTDELRRSAISRLADANA